MLWNFLQKQNALTKKPRWTKEEISKIQKCKHFSEAQKLSTTLERSPGSCVNKFQRLLQEGLVTKGPLKMIHSWSDEELSRLKRYRNQGRVHMDPKLTKKRSAYSILTTWEKMQVKKKTFSPWTPNQNSLLKTCKSLSEIANSFSTFIPHSFASCKAQWYKIKSRSF